MEVVFPPDEVQWDSETGRVGFVAIAPGGRRIACVVPRERLVGDEPQLAAPTSDREARTRRAFAANEEAYQQEAREIIRQTDGARPVVTLSATPPAKQPDGGGDGGATKPWFNDP
jgi:hypothetical protein